MAVVAPVASGLAKLTPGVELTVGLPA